MTGPIAELRDFYQEVLEREDAKGFADIYKQCTEMFVECLSKKHYTVTDLKYLDGNYIFARGTNSVVHFHIEECPGWLFGIWWAHTEDEPPCGIEFFFFAQYEEEIDKFKPSASAICTSGILHDCFSADAFIASSELHHSVATVKFIQQEPALAFCRDQYGYDYNEKYVSREEAKKMFADFMKNKKKYEEVTFRLNKECLDYYKSYIIPQLPESTELEDRGENWYPRYRLTCPLSSVVEIVEGPGAYSLEAFLKHDWRIYDDLQKFLHRLDAEADDAGIMWCRPLHDVVYVRKED